MRNSPAISRPFGGTIVGVSVTEEPEIKRFVPPQRGPGRPRKVQTVTKQEYIDDGEEEREDGFAGLFDPSVLGSIVRVRVIRKDPNEGTVGYLEDPMQGETEIAERWGGSTYVIQGLDGRGAIRKSGTVKIAGDPIFVSTAAEMQWRRSRNLPMNPGTMPAAAAAAPGMSFQELFTLMQSQDERRRTEEREHQERLRKLEIEAQQLKRREEIEYADRVRREQIEADARARRDEEERERRRVKDEEERDARRRRETAEAEQRQQQFMQQTIQMVQQSSAQALSFMKATAQQQPQGNNLMDAVKTVVAIKEAFAGEDSGGEETPMNLLIKHGGEWINGLTTGIAGAVREIKSGGVTGGAAGSAPGQAPRPAASTSLSQSPLALLPPNAPLSGKVDTLVAKLAAKGMDPIAAMEQIVDRVTTDLDGLPSVGAAQPAPSFKQGPEGIGGASLPTTAPTSSETPAKAESPKVIRLRFGKQ